MGFLSKLFGKKDETDDLFKMIMENKRRTESSANYQVSCSALRAVFYGMDFSVESFYNNLDSAKGLVQVAVGMVAKRGIKIPASYKNLPVTFVSNEDGSKYGYIVAFDDPKYECECNFVAMMIINGKKAYYTNEFYASDGTFSLCMFNADGSHCGGMGDTQTYEDFKKAVIG